MDDFQVLIEALTPIMAPGCYGWTCNRQLRFDVNRRLVNSSRKVEPRGSAPPTGVGALQPRLV